jgi:hypothetical protein
MKEYRRAEGIMEDGVKKPLPHGAEYMTVTSEGKGAAFYRIIEGTLSFWSDFFQSWNVSQMRRLEELAVPDDCILRITDEDNDDIIASVTYKHPPMTMKGNQKLNVRDFRVSYRGNHFHVHQEKWEDDRYFHTFSWLPNRTRSFEPDEEFRQTIVEYLVENF